MSVGKAAQTQAGVWAAAGEDEAESSEATLPPGVTTPPGHRTVTQVRCHTQGHLPPEEEVLLTVRLCPTELLESEQEQAPSPRAA